MGWKVLISCIEVFTGLRVCMLDNDVLCNCTVKVTGIRWSAGPQRIRLTLQMKYLG